MGLVNEALQNIPADAPDHIRELQTDHIYVDAVIRLCSHIKVPTLDQLLTNGHGRLFASVETSVACPAGYPDNRVTVRVCQSWMWFPAVSMEFATPD